MWYNQIKKGDNMLTIDQPLVPSAKEIAMAKESERQLGELKFGRKDSVGLSIDGRQMSLPVSVVRLLISTLGKIAQGKTVTMVPVEDEVSPQEAAELLGVSRPYATKLFDEKAIPSRKVGTHRRALAADVLAYKEREEAARLKVLDELAAESQRLNMGY
jgi:excisionase family DNA binding protein